MGALVEGQGFVSVETSRVILAARDRYRLALETAVHTFCHVVLGQWYHMDVMLSVADSMSGSHLKSPSELAAELGNALHGHGRVRLLLYLSGKGPRTRF